MMFGGFRAVNGIMADDPSLQTQSPNIPPIQAIMEQPQMSVEPAAPSMDTMQLVAGSDATPTETPGKAPNYKKIARGLSTGLTNAGSLMGGKIASPYGSIYKRSTF